MRLIHNPHFKIPAFHTQLESNPLQTFPISHLAIGIPQTDCGHVPFLRQQRRILRHRLEGIGGSQNGILGIVVRKAVVRGPRTMSLGLLLLRFRSIKHIVQRIEGGFVVRAGG